MISADGDRSVVIGDNGVSYRLPGGPFEFQFSYSETPKVKPLAIREPAFLPFAPPTMPRPWTGKAPRKKAKRNIKLFEPVRRDEDDEKKEYEMLRAYQLGKFETRPRDEVLGRPLSKGEIRELLKPRLKGNRQVNLGRDGLTHNMLELIHTHWRREPVCKVRCLGVPTVDMDNICRRLEEKTGGKIIHHIGGLVYLFRGRNYDHSTRPQYPVMLWKPATPVYPKLIQQTPEGLTKEEADELRAKGKDLLPITKLAKNGVYTSLVKDVRHAFEVCPIVKINCKGMHASDYKKLGAKLKELVPCVLLSFDDEQILMWRGRDWEPVHQNDVASRASSYQKNESSDDTGPNLEEKDVETAKSSPRMTSLWQSAIITGKALLLSKIDLGPDDLLEKVEEFGTTSQVSEHTYPAWVLSEEPSLSLTQQYRNKHQDDDYAEKDFEDDIDINTTFEDMESSVPLGALPIDSITMQLSDTED